MYSSESPGCGADHNCCRVSDWLHQSPPFILRHGEPWNCNLNECVSDIGPKGRSRAYEARCLDKVILVDFGMSQHVRLGISEMPIVRFCRLKALVWT